MPNRRVIQVIDLAFGDSGKGTVIDFLARRHPAATVVRFNGGPQAGHNVVTPDGRHHTFSQFGSGTFVPGVQTLLSRFMLIEPYALLNEANHLDELGVTDAMDRLAIDADCPVITPAHQAANRLREVARGAAAHGTCGMGVGELMAELSADADAAPTSGVPQVAGTPETCASRSLFSPRDAQVCRVRSTCGTRFGGADEVLRAAELADGATVRRKLLAACERKQHELREIVAGDVRSSVDRDERVRSALRTIAEPTWIDAAVEVYAEVARRCRIVGADEVRQALQSSPTLLFEGAQGVLLDERFGFHPHTTWSTTTFTNADGLLDEHGIDAPRTRLGVLRSYFTRHGAGPFVTEDASLAADLPEPHNTAAGWQGRFRVGRFDAVAARYAIDVAGGLDGLSITHLDRLRATDGGGAPGCARRTRMTPVRPT